MTFTQTMLAGALGWALASTVLADADTRRQAYLLDGWRTVATEDTSAEQQAFQQPEFDDAGWEVVRVPHNWDSYEGFRQVKHGVFHGSAWYRNTFTLEPEDDGREVFLFFEGVGSYASVWVNGKQVGHHGGGLTTFTLNVTDVIDYDGPNTVAVRADHPEGIRDLPWVCGGCELAYGFSEGTQPFGISRPVSVVVTDSLRVTPFGVHAWNGKDVENVHLTTEVRNHRDERRDFTIRNRLVDADGQTVAEVETKTFLRPGATTELAQDFPKLENPQLWSPANPYLYQVVTEIIEGGKVVDRTQTRFGIRYIEWPDVHGEPGQPLKINGEPFFVRGVADYEHLLGQSHAFSDEQVDARVSKILSAGFNTFRDAHHPHNLRFNEHWDEKGVLWWTQFGAHIWFEKEDFYNNYKALLRDWIKERRNSPSIFLYGLQNESKLPAWFAEQCVEIIRELDPTASVQRPIVTCNGGEGTDWDVPQNWSGTYGGDPYKYGEELIRQRMVGEYGAWRSIDAHSEGGFYDDAPLTEDRMTGLLEIKLGEAEKVRDQIIGHFLWPFTTHQNPGRNVGALGQQTTDGIRPLDQIGPANNKGLQTIWGEPLDAFYMYRSNYVEGSDEPMVYISSHTWPDRWVQPGAKDGIVVYGNVDEVELYNGFRTRSLGKRTRNGPGTHFKWDGADIQTNLLYAEGRIDGKVVARDWITLHHLPKDDTLAKLDPAPKKEPTAAKQELTYLYRVNAGGPAFADHAGRVWAADRVYEEGDTWGSVSWGSRFANVDPRFGSKRRIFDPVLGTSDDALFQSFRYGRQELQYVFEVPNGTYEVELYFIEPWYGLGNTQSKGWRLFDVAINDETVLERLDLFAEAGRAKALKRTVTAQAKDGKLVVHFPQIEAGQAVISAIAVASKSPVKIAAPTPSTLFRDVKGAAARTWLDTGVKLHIDQPTTLTDLSWELREADWLQLPSKAGKQAVSFSVAVDTNLYAAVDASLAGEFADWEGTPFTLETSARDEAVSLVRKRVSAGDAVTLPTLPIALLAERRFPPPPAAEVFDFVASGSQRPDGVRAVGNLRAGQPLYSDGGPAIAKFESRLSDADWIQLPQADADNPDLRVRFRVEDHTEVHVGLDARVTEFPAWMSDWIDSRGWKLFTTDDGETGYRFRKKRFLPGETVELGPNAKLPNGEPARMYVGVIQTVRAAFTLQTEGQKEATGYRAASVPGYTGEGYVDLQGSGLTQFPFEISVGVGDRYGLNFRYQSRSNEPIPAKMTIINTADGALVCDDDVVFQPTERGEWGLTRLRTCDSINAGVYHVIIETPQLESLIFDSLEVE
ncbi:MAG: malectin domain-containing carbohydrate-binding protein [Verrucomicrobiota bacterium JB022]|nr:malectin domain-containing carbohydrate-binding protein [Verrucomicrobiota bacterium JB022]